MTFKIGNLSENKLFLQFLREKTRQVVKLNYNESIFEKTTKYLQEILDDNEVSSYDILMLAVNTMLIHRYLDRVTMEIDNMIELDGIKLSSLVELIDNGNIELRGHHIFDSSLLYIKKNIAMICKEYLVYIGGALNGR